MTTAVPLSKVLFVDDEVRVLEGLRDSLRKQRKRWSMQFVVGGEAALAQLETERFDVVVTDLRMPKVDGVAVLEHLQRSSPDTVRIVLSGDPGKDLAVKFLPYAHQALTKPCRIGELEAVLTRACRVREIVTHEGLRRFLGGVQDLPPLPKTYQRLQRIFDDERTGVREVADVVGEDIAVSAKILKLANSAFFGVGRDVRNIADAVAFLGMDAVKNLVLSTAVFEGPTLPASRRAFAESLHEHSVAIGRVASELVDARWKRDAFMAGLLHDVGRLVLGIHEGDTADLRDTGSATLSNGELVSHAHVGAYLLGLWGLPLPVIDAVGAHHGTPDECPTIVAHSVMAAELASEILEGAASDYELLRKESQEIFDELRTSLELATAETGT
jgi:putative nucleotidyltransferase with HDIG domain